MIPLRSPVPRRYLSPLPPPPRSLHSLPSKPPMSPQHLPALPSPPSDFEEKMLCLDSLGIDFLSLISRWPPLVSGPLPSLKSTIAYLLSIDFNTMELRRIVGMCPEALSLRPRDILPVFTFLLRAACVAGSDLCSIINRRPRLLVCSVSSRIRPTFYFLQSIGISQVNKHTNLLSCSVEDKLVPRFEHFKNVGFSHKDSITMFRRFPQLFSLTVSRRTSSQSSIISSSRGVVCGCEWNGT